MQAPSDVEIKDRYYGKEFIKIAQVEKNGEVHTIREYEMELKLTLAGVREYTTADNRDIVCADACKDAVYVLANNHGIKSPEEFGILVCNHFLSLYGHMTNVCLTIEDYSWNRLSYDAEANVDEGVKLHNHAFIHRPECIRTCSVTMNRKDMAASVRSGLKNLNLVKTSQATFVGFHRDAYRTLQDLHERVLSTNVSCTWSYTAAVTDIDYDEIWRKARDCIVRSWGGDPIKGVHSSCMQFTLHSAGKNVLDTIPEITSIDLLMPNLLYAPFNVETFKSVIKPQADRQIFLHVTSPSGLAAATIDRKSKV